jgi:hypothetical protein
VSAALLAAALALPALAADAPPLPEVPTAVNAPGWSRQGKSLLLYDHEGTLSHEIGLSREESASGLKETLGGHSPDRRVAWTLERKLNYDPRGGRLLESRRSLKVFGAAGQLLWSDDACDLPQTGEPVVFSDDSMTALVALHFGESWSVEGRDWTGGVLMRAGPFPRLHSIGLAPGGRFAQARWSVPDKSDTHTFLDLKARKRQDVETSDLTFGLARIGDDGVARSGRKIAAAFSLALSTAAAGAK